MVLPPASKIGPMVWGLSLWLICKLVYCLMHNFVITLLTGSCRQHVKEAVLLGRSWSEVIVPIVAWASPSASVLDIVYQLLMCVLLFEYLLNCVYHCWTWILDMVYLLPALSLPLSVTMVTCLNTTHSYHPCNWNKIMSELTTSSTHSTTETHS